MEDPAARRARLKALREAADAAQAVQQPQQEEDAPQEVLLKFRNYNPVNQKDMVHEKVSLLQSMVSFMSLHLHWQYIGVAQHAKCAHAARLSIRQQPCSQWP